MQIQVNTDHNIEGHEALAAQVRGVVESDLSRFNDHITRVEVHLSDERSHKRGHNDKRCMMEARLAGHQPSAVTHQAATLDQAVVRTMKAVAASSIGQYEKSVLAVADYYRSLELGLGACFRASGPALLLE